MITLYDSAFSPFARKVRMVLEHKRLEAEYVDGLLLENHDRLRAVNGRVEVPALTDGDLTVINSADIVAYLDHRYPSSASYTSLRLPRSEGPSRCWSTRSSCTPGIRSW